MLFILFILSPNEKRLHFLSDLRSQSEFRTQRKSQGRLHQRYLNRHLVNLRLTLSGD